MKFTDAVRLYGSYFGRVMKHKWHVFQAGRVTRAPLWRLIVHDLSKFRPDEFGPYARYFGSAGKPPQERREEFRIAWAKHLHRNPHHCGWWILRNQGGDNGTEILPMPESYVREMVADWMGASATYTDSDKIYKWLMVNLGRMTMHPKTWERLQMVLAELPEFADNKAALELLPTPNMGAARNIRDLYSLNELAARVRSRMGFDREAERSKVVTSYLVDAVLTIADDMRGDDVALPRNEGFF